MTGNDLAEVVGIEVNYYDLLARGGGASADIIIINQDM
jgi:hypothetical protein